MVFLVRDRERFDKSSISKDTREREKKNGFMIHFICILRN